MALLEVENLAKGFHGTAVVHDVSFRVERGHCVALLGPNGAGKTTTLKILAGLIKPDGGSIRFNGENVQDIRPHLGYLPQHPGFHDWMTGSEFLIYVAELAGLGKAQARERSRAVLARLGLDSAAKRPIGGYSGGMKQRLGIGQALIHQPALLILDEPVSALDPVGRREILALLADLRGETTVLYSTHVLHDAEEISDDVLILVEGKMVIAGAVNEVQQRFEHPKIELSAATSLEPYHSLWSRLASVQQLQGKGNHVSIVATDLVKAREDILRIVTEEHIPVQRLEFGKSTLEDLFMEVVQS